MLYAFWGGLVDAVSSAPGVGISTAASAVTNTVIAVTTVGLMWFGWIGLRTQREGVAPLIEVVARSEAGSGDFALAIEASNRTSTTMVLESVEVLEPRTALLVHKQTVPGPGSGTALIDKGSAAASLALDKAVRRAGSTRMQRPLSWHRGEREPATEQPADVIMLTTYLRLPQSTNAHQVVLQFTIRLRTNRNRLIKQKVWVDLPPVKG